jgi:hypothetical protein
LPSMMSCLGMQACGFQIGVRVCFGILNHTSVNGYHFKL